MKKVSLSCLLALGFLPAAAQATGFGYTPWHAELSGTIQGDVSLRNELGLESSASHGFLVDDGWLKLSYTPVDFSGSGEVDGDFTFQGVTFSDSETVRTHARFADMAGRALWQPYDSLGLGLTLKLLDGEVDITDEDGETQQRTISEVFPMASLVVSHPLNDLFRLGGEASYIRYDDDEVLELGLDVEIRGEQVGVKFGWHEKRYRVEDGDFQLDTRLKGLFAQIVFYI